MTTNWIDLKGKRLLLTDKTTRISRNEWTLLEVSPAGLRGKFRNEICNTQFWNDFDKLLVLEILSNKLT